MTPGRGLSAGRLLATCELSWPLIMDSGRRKVMAAGAARRRFFFVSDFKKLHVWQKAHALSLCVDRISKEIRDARYASLRSQIFRAATSIPANIAEGRRQESEKEF